MTDLPAVSFVIPCYNYARFLRDCLDSIFAQQEAPGFEIIAVDDASTDETQQVLRSYQDPRLKVLTHTVNQGHAVTLKDGLQAARGAFLARIDPDDRYKPYFLAATLRKFKEFPEVGLVYGNVALINERGEVTLAACDHAVHGKRDFKGNEFIQLLKRNFICAPTVIARREVWQSVPPVPDHLAFHDWYYTLQMARRVEFYYTSEILADYRVHSQNLHTQIIRNKSEEGSIFWLLDRVYAEKEPDERLERQKQAAKKQVYAGHTLGLAEKYFYMNMNAEARRCYLRAFRLHPAWILKWGLFRRFLATLLGRRLYEAAKRLIRLRS